jgi:hypothetical protein
MSGISELASRRSLGILTAKTYDGLAEMCEPLGLCVRGYGDPAVWVLAQRSLRPAPEPPALLQLTRGARGSDWLFELQLVWRGEEPTLSESDRVTVIAIVNNGSQISTRAEPSFNHTAPYRALITSSCLEKSPVGGSSI